MITYLKKKGKIPLCVEYFLNLFFERTHSNDALKRSQQGGYYEISKIEVRSFRPYTLI